METLDKMIVLMEKITIESKKVEKSGNHLATKRARKYAQELKETIFNYRKEVLNLHKLKKGKL